MGRVKRESPYPRTPTLTALEKELARKDLAAYAALIHPKFHLYPHTKVVFDSLQQVEDGTVDRLAIAQPPRHGKSLGSSQLLPAHMIGQRPHLQCITITWGDSLTRRFGRYVRNCLRHPRHREIFPESALADDSMAVNEFATTANGAYSAVGRKGGIVGKGANLLVLDDLLKSRSEARSESVVQGIIDDMGAMYSRLEPTYDGFKPAVVVNAHRWAENDITGYLLEEHADDGWVYLPIPAIREALAPGEKLPPWEWRKPGNEEALWPERFPTEVLRREQRRNELDFQTLYQQNVKGQGGREFKIKWLDDTPRYRRISKGELNVYIFVDPANALKRRSDYTVILVIGLAPDGNIYVLDMIRDRLDLIERTKKLFEVWVKWRPIHTCYYEQISMQSDIQHIRERMEFLNRRFSLVAIGDGRRIAKEDRIRELLPLFEQHKIIFPIEMRGMSNGQEIDLYRAFRAEYEAFPGGAHDDMMDALSRIRDPKVWLTWPLTNEQYERKNLWDEWTQLDGGTTWVSA
jgi:predicted phage terminase large subunit-like protein